MIKYVIAQTEIFKCNIHSMKSRRFVVYINKKHGDEKWVFATMGCCVKNTRPLR